MIGTNRSFEHRGHAVNRTHLMPVSPMDAPCNRVGRIEMALTMLIVLVVATFVIGKVFS